MERHKESLLEDLGLAQQNQKPYRKKTYHIDKGEVDVKSHGGIAMLSTGRFADDGCLAAMSMRYWAIYPDGRYELQNLFELDTEPIGHHSVRIKSLTVLGRDIPLNDSKAIDNVIEAIRRIHVNLRDREAELPHVASIFKDCCLEDIVGEKLPLPAFHQDMRIYFPITANFNWRARGKNNPDMVLPLEAIRPLMGIRKNTVDVDHSYLATNRLRVRGTLPQVGRKFELSSALEKRKSKKRHENERQLDISQKELDTPTPSQKGRNIIKASWDVITPDSDAARGLARLRTLRLFDNNILHSGFRGVMSALGVINKTHADMLKLRDYPRLQDHMAEYGHLDMLTSSSQRAPVEGRFVLTSMGGNNLREIYPGIGEDIGGNCKVVETQWWDKKKGATQKLGVILDLGAYIIKQQSHWTGGGADVVEKLSFCHHIFISHHHLDHLDFIIPYIKRGIITPQHTLHFTPEVYEMAKDKLTKWGIKKHDQRMPQLNLLSGAGVIDIRDTKNVIRMSVAYGVDAVPHSAKDTPFIAYGRMGQKILGSYMYLGDMRYDEDWFADHDSAFWNPVQLMLDHDPGLKAEAAKLIPTYTEQDGTSTKRYGRGAREREVEDNLVGLITHCLSDMDIGIPMIGTNDGRRETGLRVANRTGRNVTAFGSAVEKIFEIANKWGVNPYRCPRPEQGKYTGIADYLKWHAEQEGIDVPAQFAGRTSQTVAKWFESKRRGKILAFLSGSQGNEVERESVTYKLSEGLSYFDADPKTSRTARPADMRKWAIIVSQGAIPGNQTHQRKMIRKLAARGAIVFESFDDNIRVYNAGRIRDKLVTYMKARGIDAIVEADTLVFQKFSIHASGHGRNGDFRLWLHKLQAKFYGVHHTDDMESVQVAYETIEEEGKQHPGRIFENAEEIDIGTDSVRPIGRTHSSVILTREISEEGKHYNKRLEAVRVINYDDRSLHNDLGLRASAKGVFETHFGVEDVNDLRRREGASNDGVDDESPVRSAFCHAKPRRLHARPVLQTPPWPYPEDPKVA